MNNVSENPESSNAIKPMLGDVVMIQSNRINILNKIHFNSSLRKNDTLCSKNFSFPDAGTNLITYKDGEIFMQFEQRNGLINESKIEEENICKKCLAVFLNNIA